MKPNARKAAVPLAATEVALADETGATVRRALWLDALDRQLRPLLPPGLAPHCRLANVSGSQLVFLVDSPVWRARLRLAEAELLDAARSIGLDPTSVAIKSTTTPLAPPAVQARPPRVSETARKAIGDALASLREPDPSGPPVSGTPGPGRGTGRGT